MMDCNQMLDAFGWMQMLSMQRNAEIALFKKKNESYLKRNNAAMRYWTINIKKEREGVT